MEPIRTLNFLFLWEFWQFRTTFKSHRSISGFSDTFPYHAVKIHFLSALFKKIKVSNCYIAQYQCNIWHIREDISYHGVTLDILHLSFSIKIIIKAIYRLYFHNSSGLFCTWKNLTLKKWNLYWQKYWCWLAPDKESWCY